MDSQRGGTDHDYDSTDKVLIAFDMRDWFLPIMAILVPVGMLYHWYSMSYDLEQKDIINKLKKGGE